MKAAVIRRLAVTDAVLAGFSHEAFHALEIAFSVLAAPDAIVAFTGCRVGKVDDHRPDRLPPA